MRVILMLTATFWILVGLLTALIAEHVGWPIALLVDVLLLVSMFYGLPALLVGMEEDHDETSL